MFQTPSEITSGPFTLVSEINAGSNEKNSFDLDRSILTDGTEADLSFTTSCGSDCFPYIDPLNGAEIYVIIDQAVEYKTCFENINKFSEYESFKVVWGKQDSFCIFTNQGNLSLVTVIHEAMGGYGLDGGPDILHLTYTTWHNPVLIPSPPVVTKMSFMLDTHFEQEPNSDNSVDLDQGPHKMGTVYDLFLSVGCGSPYPITLHPINGAKGYVIHNQAAEYSTCIENI